MQLLQFSLFAVPALALHPVCRGNVNCANTPGDIEGVKNIVDSIMPRDKFFAPGTTIACDGNKCAVFNVKGGTAQEASDALQGLRNEGCTKCGQYPTQPSHQIGDGNIQVNWTDKPCSGAC